MQYRSFASGYAPHLGQRRTVATNCTPQCMQNWSIASTSLRHDGQRCMVPGSGPAPGMIRGNCPGYVIVHVTALCAGGNDRWSNMEWLAKENTKLRQQQDQKQCEDFKRLVEGKAKK